MNEHHVMQSLWLDDYDIGSLWTDEMRVGWVHDGDGGIFDGDDDGDELERLEPTQGGLDAGCCC